MLAILAAALALRVGFASVLPPFQAPDERAHLDYVRTLAIFRGLPVQPRLAPAEALESWPQSYQPPLAYLLFSPAALASEALGAGRVTQLRMLRLQNALYGTALVAVIFAVAARLRPRGDPLRVAAPALAAAWPGLAANSASLNNDGLAVLLAGVFWWVWLREAPGVRRGLASGAVLGAACLAKLTAATLLPLCLLLPWLEGRDLRAAVIEAGAAATVWLFLLFPWMLRNTAVYGDPLAVGVGSFSFAALRAAGLPADFLAQVSTPAPGKALLQLFGRFGITNNLSWSPVAAAWLPLVLLGALGWVRARDARRRLPPPANAGLAAAVVLATLGLVAFSLRYYGAWQGRYLYVAAAPIALLVAHGLAQWLPRERSTAAALALGLLLALLTAALLVQLAHFYGEAARAEWGLRTAL